MFSGRDTLGVIDQHVDSARQSIDTAHSRLEQLNQQATALSVQFSEYYKSLARFRLDDLTAERVVKRLDDTDRAVMALLERRSQAMQQLQAAIEASVARQSDLTARRQTQEERRDEALKAMEAAFDEISKHLKEDDAYQVQAQRASEAVAKADKAEEKASEAEQSREEKGKPYRDDSLFMYLWQRGYSTPDYNGGTLTRQLDGWVSKLIDYGDARANYYMLNELPVRLREHATRQRQIADQELQSLHSLEAKAAEQEGIPKLQAVLQEEEKALHGIDNEIESEEARHETLLKDRAQFTSFSDQHARQALELYAAQIKEQPLADLHRQALATPEPDDDVIVAGLRRLQQEELRLAAEIQDAREEQRRKQEALRELESIRQQFRRSNYDSNQSFFPSGFELAMLLQMLLQRRVSSGDVWDQIREGQQFRRPRIPDDFGGGIRFPGGFGGGGSGGGDFGGGGFRTGGGF